MTYHDDAPVLISESTKYIVLFKIPNNKNLSEEYFKKELSSNGTVKINIPTTKSDDSGFTLRVGTIADNKNIMNKTVFYACFFIYRRSIWMKNLTLDIFIRKEYPNQRHSR